MKDIAEKAVLGTCLEHNYLILDSGLFANHFESALHQKLFRSMRELSQQRKSVDVVTLTTLYNDEEGFINYLVDLQRYSNEKKFDEYVELVLNKWRNGRKQNILLQASLDNWEDEKIIQELSKIVNNRINDHKSLSSVLVDYMTMPFEKQEVKRGVPTGIGQLDKVLNGFQDSELTILAARPSMGKTDSMLHFAKCAGWAGFLPIIFSLEMSTEKLVERLIGSAGNYNRTKLRNPSELLTDGQKENWASALGRLNEAKIEFFDAPAQKVSDMRMKVRKLINDFPNKKPIIFIDYLTIIKSDNPHQNKHIEVGEITQELKNMAKQFECPIVSLAQLSRSVEKRDNKRPMNSDLRESGNIEEIADTIIFLYRESYYKPDEWKGKPDELEFIISKNRNGECRKVTTQYNRFTGVIKDDTNSK